MAMRPAQGGIEFRLHRLGAVGFTGSTVLPRGCIHRHPGELEPDQRGETRLLNLHDMLQPSSAALGSEHVRQGQEHGSIAGRIAQLRWTEVTPPVARLQRLIELLPKHPVY